MAIRALVAGILFAFAATTALAAPSGKTPAKGDAPAATSGVAEGDGTFDVEAAKAEYERKQLAIYDALVADSSPRAQILTLDVYISDDDPTMTALRPKPADVAARAVGFAPDDPFVQWLAAKHGHYFSSKCGPTRWPETEVANLVRLEPDNAGAWQYVVALAQSKGDANAVDEALSRMAATARADDHLVDEIAAWKAAYVAHPEIAIGPEFDDDGGMAPSDKGAYVALEHVSFGKTANLEALKEACTPDADSDRTWRRLGWCADAGRILAGKGSSLALRANGLAMLKATGEQSDAIEKAGRQYDWLAANDGNQSESAGDEVDDVSSPLDDWRDAKSEIEAIEHRLKRLGLPLTPPPGWNKPKSSPATNDTAQAFAKAYADYMLDVFGDMRRSGSPEARVFAALNGEFIAAFAMTGAKGAPASDAATGSESIATLAAANATNLKVQWMIAAGSKVPDETKANAIAAVQQAEPDNAGAWALSLAHASPTDPLADTLLQRMAASKRYDTHVTYGAQVMLDAVRRRPMPPELVAMGQSAGLVAGREISGDVLAKTLALSTAYMMTMSPAELPRACSTTNAAAGTPRRETCIAVGRLLVHSGATMLDVNFGESILQHLGTLDGADAERVREVKWWYESMSSSTQAREMPSDAVLAYIDDYIASGNEVEALGRYAAKVGTSAPPAGWTPRKPRK